MLRDALALTARPCEGTCDEKEEAECVEWIGGKNRGESGLGGYNLLRKEDTDFDWDKDVLSEDLESTDALSLRSSGAGMRR